ncbi:MAG: J domain-containing protein [Acidobacteriia bacterium]|nr:J domain-containing protein [Terriglobia bacterium]
MRHRKSIYESCLVLGLNPGASSGEVRRAYLLLVKRWHPDQFAQDSSLQHKAEEKLKEINEAYAILRDPGSMPSYTHQGSTSSTGGYRYRYTPPPEEEKRASYESTQPRQRKVPKWVFVWLVWFIVGGIVRMSEGTDHTNASSEAPSQVTLPAGMARAMRTVPVSTAEIDPKLLAPRPVRMIWPDMAKKPVPQQWKRTPYKVEITQDDQAAWKHDPRVPLRMKGPMDKPSEAK